LGADAPVIAAQRADEMLAQGDIDGQLVRKRIIGAINELQRGTPSEGERRH